MSILKIYESNNDRIDYDISEEKELRKILFDLAKRDARVVIIEIPCIGIFTIGVGLPFGFIQFSKTGEPPYLIASEIENTEDLNYEEEIEFDANGTPTPILKRFCLPYEKIVNIVSYLFIKRELPLDINWEKI